MTQPLLYLSPYFERHKEQYMDALLEVSRSGAWLEWITFFLRGVVSTCEEAIVTVRQLLDLQAQYRARLQQASLSARAVQLVDLLFDEPFVTIPRVQKALALNTYRGAKMNIDKLVEAGILTDLPGTDRPKVYAAPEIFAIIQGREGQR